MIIETVKGTSIDNVEFEDSVKMTFDESASVFLLQAISESLYKRPAMKVADELVGNAFDSHLRAGQTRPLEVHLPTSLNPNFIVQDWGTGMSKADISDLYSKVGGSDKRETNKERGGYGLGSKSPLALTPSFSLISIKNGIKHIIAVIRDENGIPDFKFISSAQTDEPNGVTVSVPISDVQEMRAATENLFICYPPGSILVDGKEPEYSIHNPKQFQRIGDYGWYALDKEAVEDFKGASGEILGVRYDITTELDGGVVSRLGGNKRIILSLPNGEVKVETSRESIRAVQQSRDAITPIAEGWVEEFRTQAAKRLEAAERSDALVYHASLPKWLREELTTWRGENIPEGDLTFFPVQTYDVPSLADETVIERRALPADSPSYIRPPYLAGVAPRNTTRYTARLIKLEQKHDRANDLSELNVVYLLDSADPKSVSHAERDIRDYERWLERGGVITEGRTTNRYLTDGKPEDFDPWFRSIAQFVPIEAVSESALEERREYRRAAAVRRAANNAERVARPARPKRDYTLLRPKLSSDSDRARLDVDSEDGESLGIYVHGVKADIPDDATEVEAALLENKRIGGGGKVAYIVPDSNAKGGGPSDLLARIIDRSAHPGRDQALLAVWLVELLQADGYRVVALRASQKVEDILDDVPGALPASEALAAVLEAAVDNLAAEETSLALWTDGQDASVMKKVSGHLAELHDPIFAVGGTAPNRAATRFLAILRHGKFRWNRARREQHSESLAGNLNLLALGDTLTQKVMDTHDYITELSLRDRYPLSNGTSSSGEPVTQHLILYINAVYDNILNVTE